MLTEARFDELTDELASGTCSEAGLLAEWASRLHAWEPHAGGSWVRSKGRAAPPELNGATGRLLTFSAARVVATRCRFMFRRNT